MRTLLVDIPSIIELYVTYSADLKQILSYSKFLKAKTLKTSEKTFNMRTSFLLMNGNELREEHRRSVQHVIANTDIIERIHRFCDIASCETIVYGNVPRLFVEHYVPAFDFFDTSLLSCDIRENCHTVKYLEKIISLRKDSDLQFVTINSRVKDDFPVIGVSSLDDALHTMYEYERMS